MICCRHLYVPGIDVKSVSILVFSSGETLYTMNYLLCSLIMKIYKELTGRLCHKWTFFKHQWPVGKSGDWNL